MTNLSLGVIWCDYYNYSQKEGGTLLFLNKNL